MRFVWIACLALGCDSSFDFGVHANDDSNGQAQIFIDGVEHASTTRTYDDLDDAIAHPVLIETRRNGVVLHTCTLYAGSCARAGCGPAREASTVCVLDDGSIKLNTWDCACSGSTGDWFCSGDCAETAPQ